MKNLLKKAFNKMANKKGQGGVESIVAFVVTSALSAIMLPSMLPYLDDARELKTILEARYAYMATQQVTLLNYAEINFTTWPASGDLKKVSEIANCPEENIRTVEFDTYGNITRFVYDNGLYEATFISSEGWTAEKMESNIITAVASANVNEFLR